MAAVAVAVADDDVADEEDVNVGVEDANVDDRMVCLIARSFSSYS